MTTNTIAVTKYAMKCPDAGTSGSIPIRSTGRWSKATSPAPWSPGATMPASFSRGIDGEPVDMDKLCNQPGHSYSSWQEVYCSGSSHQLSPLYDMIVLVQQWGLFGSKLAMMTVIKCRACYQYFQEIEERMAAPMTLLAVADIIYADNTARNHPTIIIAHVS